MQKEGGKKIIMDTMQNQDIYRVPQNKCTHTLTADGSVFENEMYFTQHCLNNDSKCMYTFLGTLYIIGIQEAEDSVNGNKIVDINM